MKRAGLKVTVLLTESPYDDKELTFAGMVDGCWTNERSSLQAFRNVNPCSGYIPHGWHPDRHKTGPQPGDEDVPAHDVVFVGTGFQERIDFLHDINWDGIDLGLYGTWEGLGSNNKLRKHLRDGPVPNDKAAALYRRAKINLNIYRASKGWGKDAVRVTHAESINPRGYELAACGAFHLSTYRSEVKDVFGDLVPTFTAPDEAEALIRSWLDDPEGRTQVARALPARVAESSWSERATGIIGDIQTLMGRSVAA
jgi:spore maturation protein CgeB